MVVCKIIHDPMFLRQKSKLATKEDIGTVEDLKDTLIANQKTAAGLAANMIGKSKRIIAFYVGTLPMVMLNPQIMEESGSYQTKEGCLSLSGTRATNRYKTIVVEYQNMSMKNQRQQFTNFIAETIQHEIDHCNGILI